MEEKPSFCSAYEENHNESVALCTHCKTWICEACVRMHSMHIHEVKYFEESFQKAKAKFSNIHKLASRSIEMLNHDIILPNDDNFLKRIESRINHIFQQLIQSLKQEKKTILEKLKTQSAQNLIQAFRQQKTKAQQIKQQLNNVIQDVTNKISNIEKTLKHKNFIQMYSIISSEEINKKETQLQCILAKPWANIENLVKINHNLNSLKVEYFIQDSPHDNTFEFLSDFSSENWILHYFPWKSCTLHLIDVKTMQHDIFPVPNSPSNDQWGFGSIKIGDQIFICGGNRGRGDHYCFDIDRQTFTKEATMIYKVFGHGLTQLNNSYYSIGGSDIYDHAKNTSEKYSLDERKWDDCPKMNISRHCPGASSIKGRFLYVIGGYDGKQWLHTFEELDCESEFKEWALITVLDEWYSRSNSIAIQFNHHQILICGGEVADQQYVDEVFLFDIETSTIRKLEGLQANTHQELSRGAGVVVGGKAYFIMDDQNIHVVSKHLTQMIEWKEK